MSELSATAQLSIQPSLPRKVMGIHCSSWKFLEIPGKSWKFIGIHVFFSEKKQHFQVPRILKFRDGAIIPRKRGKPCFRGMQRNSFTIVYPLQCPVGQNRMAHMA